MATMTTECPKCHGDKSSFTICADCNDTGRIELRGGTNNVGVPLTWGEELATATERIDATTIDTLQIASAILAGKPYNAGNLAYVICRREHVNAEGLGKLLAESFNGEELAHMLALTLAVLGASKAK